MTSRCKPEAQSRYANTIQPDQIRGHVSAEIHHHCHLLAIGTIIGDRGKARRRFSGQLFWRSEPRFMCALDYLAYSGNKPLSPALSMKSTMPWTYARQLACQKGK